MELKNSTESINKIQLSNTGIINRDFNVLWVSATDRFNSDTLTTHFHHHTFFELHIMLCGHIVYGFDDRQIRVSSGNMLIIPTGVRHTVLDYSDTFSKLTIAFETINSDFFNDAFEKLGNSIIQVNAILNNILQHFIEICTSKSEFKNELALLSLIEYIYAVCSCCGIKNHDHNHCFDECDARILKAKKYINDNTDIFFTCEDVANYCHISTKQLGRLFREKENLSLLEYIHKRKLDCVIDFLVNTDMTQKQIANRLGFSSVQYLCKFVKSQTGKTPKELSNNRFVEL